ncbi:putative selenium delivery protein YdfZ [Escherichia coli]|nr:putative selenium delivery protein YdfZ [Escherichia coli]
MTTYDRNRNAITTGGKTVVVEGCEEKLAPLDLIRLGMN